MADFRLAGLALAFILGKEVCKGEPTPHIYTYKYERQVGKRTVNIWITIKAIFRIVTDKRSKASAYNPPPPKNGHFGRWFYYPVYSG